MDKTAYNLGVELALRDAGLVKEAGPMWEGVKRVARGAWHNVKDYASLKNVRDALRAYGTASSTALHLDPTKAVTALNALGTPSAGRALRNLLQTATGETAKQVALRNVGKSLVPYAVPLGLGAAGLGGYYGAKKLFPKAFGD